MRWTGEVLWGTPSLGTVVVVGPGARGIVPTSDLLGVKAAPETPDRAVRLFLLLVPFINLPCPASVPIPPRREAVCTEKGVPDDFASKTMCRAIFFHPFPLLPGCQRCCNRFDVYSPPRWGTKG